MLKYSVQAIVCYCTPPSIGLSRKANKDPNFRIGCTVPECLSLVVEGQEDGDPRLCALVLVFLALAAAGTRTAAAAVGGGAGMVRLEDEGHDQIAKAESVRTQIEH